MREARWRSSKVSKVTVDGSSGVPVPRESVYDTELMSSATGSNRMDGLSLDSGI